MTPILIIIGLILLFKFVLTSHASGNVPQTTSVVNTGSCGSGGDNFTSGSGFVAGISEPTHCNMVRVGIKTFPQPAPMPVRPIPIHITYPVAPAPIKVTIPTPRPLPRPIVSPGARFIRNTPCYGVKTFGSGCGAVFECGGRLMQEP